MKQTNFNTKCSKRIIFGFFEHVFKTFVLTISTNKTLKDCLEVLPECLFSQIPDIAFELSLKTKKNLEMKTYHCANEVDPAATWYCARLFRPAVALNTHLDFGYL